MRDVKGIFAPTLYSLLHQCNSPNFSCP